MKHICDETLCSGCLACYNVCLQNAIDLIRDKEGFIRPTINEQKCVHCNICAKVCPQTKELPIYSYDKKVYAAWSKNKKTRKVSTSGGAFTEIASRIIKDGGVVFGVGFDEELNVVHKHIDTKDDLSELRGSKYVQSDIGLSFKQVRSFLLSGKKVLFSGTPCQVDGLYSYLGKRYEAQLYTIDLVCHGVPSPVVYDRYIKYLNKYHNAKAKKVYFRDKKPGWAVFGMKVVFDNGKKYRATTYNDPYIRGFLREYFLRPSCHSCKYSNKNRVADITLSDFWGYKQTCRKDRDNDKGISMVMINSTNGFELFETVKSSLVYFERSVEEAVKGNRALSSCFPPSPKREEFWLDYNALSFDEIITKYLYPEKNPWYPRLPLRRRLKQSIHHLLNKVLRKVIGEERYQKLKKTLKRVK